MTARTRASVVVWPPRPRGDYEPSTNQGSSYEHLLLHSPRGRERHLRNRRQDGQPARLRGRCSCRATASGARTRDHDEPSGAASALALGVTLIDTADSYGPSRRRRPHTRGAPPLPRGFRDRDQSRATRSGPAEWGLDAGPSTCAGLRGEPAAPQARQNRPLPAHRIDPNVPADEQFGTLTQLQEEGKIQHVGLSEVSIAEIEAAQRSCRSSPCRTCITLGFGNPRTCSTIAKGRHRLHSVVPDRERPARRPGERGRELAVSGRDVGADRTRVAARALAGDPADPGTCRSRTSRRTAERRPSS